MSDEQVTILLRAFRAGAFGPRLEDASGNEPRQCDWCEVSSACVRGDSGARHRLARWLAATRADEAAGSEPEAALAGVLGLQGGVK